MALTIDHGVLFHSYSGGGKAGEIKSFSYSSQHLLSLICLIRTKRRLILKKGKRVINAE